MAVGLVTSSIIASCSSLWEKNISMRKFNHPIQCENEGLPTPQAVSMNFSPQIDALITNHRPFLAEVDSTYLLGLVDEFRDMLAKCNLQVKYKATQRFSIKVNHVLFKEELVSIHDLNSDMDPASVENRIIIVIRGSITDRHSRTTEPIDIKTIHKTETDSSTFFNLLTLNTEFEETKGSNTIQMGMIEANSIQSFANGCSAFIKKQVGHE